MQAIKKVSLTLACVLALGASSALAANDFVTLPGMEQRPVVTESPLDAVQADPEVMRAPSVYVTRGKIVAIEDGRYVVKGEGSRKVIAAAVDKDTYIVDGESGKLRLPRALKVGQSVTVYYSAMMTRSLPAQSHAYAVIIGEPDEKTAAYFEVAQAALASDGSYVTVLNSNNDLIATVDAKACKDFAKIKKGDKLLLWSSFATMSLPAQTNADKVVVLP